MRSNFRLRDSINTVETLIDKAIELGHNVVAITDHETVASYIRVEKYYNKIKEKNPDFKVIRGNEIYLCKNGLNAENFNKEIDKYYHFVLLATNEKGNEQIRELSTRAWMRSFTERKMQRVPTYYSDLFDVIGQNKGNVIGSTACIGGALGTQLLKYRETKDEQLYEKIKHWCKQLNELFGQDYFYLEIQPSSDDEQIYVNKMIVQLSYELNIPIIITNDAHYLSIEDKPLHAAYLNSQDGDREVEDFYKYTYLMKDEEIHKLLEDVIGKEEIEKAYQNIQKIKDMCEDYTLMKPLKIPRLNWKEVDVSWDDRKSLMRLIPYLDIFEQSEYEEDRRLAEIIIARIVDDITLQNQETYDEVNACLEDTWISSEVNGSRWSAYFLNLQNIIDVCWDSGTLVGCGRGSGVGFILLYILGITQINPLKEDTKTFRWRFLNPQRVSVLDVDVDIEGGRRTEVLHNFRKVYGNDRVANVLTLGTEKSKQAILTAARGLGVDIDKAQYLSSMIVADRGQPRTLHQTFYGDEENGIEPNKTFVFEMTENYPKLWEVAQRIEGLICRVGVHAGGVIFVDEPFTKTTALMRSPKGEIITQFDLHDAEDTGLIKYDILSVEALDKIHNCLELLKEDGIVSGNSLKEIYENTIGIYKLDRDIPEMWEMCHNHEVLSLFQMEKQSGIQGIAAMKPTSVDDLAVLNSAIRLMAQEKGGEIPVNKLARFKANNRCWDVELSNYGLGEKEKKILEPILKTSYGLCIAQEQFMELVQLPELGGFDLTWADKLRKSIAKKNPAAYDELTKEYFKTIKEKQLDYGFCNYVWNVLIAMSKGYGFNQSHTLAYSLIALQELNLAYKFPIIYWNCACLIADAGGAEKEEEEYEEQKFEYTNYYNEMEEFSDEDSEEDIVDSYEEEDCDGYPVEVVKLNNGKKKKKVNKTNYGKIASAIGKMVSEGVEVSAPNINNSGYTFKPDIKHNRILYGLSGISKVGKELVQNIMDNRPYESLEDLMSKVKMSKPQLISLIKSGALDEFGEGSEPREYVMKQYIDIVSEKKKKLNLQNLSGLVRKGLLAEDMPFGSMVVNFNNYLKKFKDGEYYVLDNNSLRFYTENFDVDLLYPDDYGNFRIKRNDWDNIYEGFKNTFRTYIKANHDKLLKQYNDILFNELWYKYCQGSISKWEMDSVSYYSHEHELAKADLTRYNCSNFFGLDEEPQVEKTIWIKGKQVQILKIYRIAGTVLDKDKNKGMITLLTKEGVVEVKVFGPVFAQYDKQISEKGLDGVKHVKEKSWLSRGNKIIVTGIRKGDSFIAKKYQNTPYHLIELIENIEDDGTLRTKVQRYGEE